MSRMPAFWQRWPASLRWAVSISIAIHLLIIFPLAFHLYTPIAMPQAPLSAVLRGAGDTAQMAKTESKQRAPLSAGDSKKPTPPVKNAPLIKTKNSELATEVIKSTAPTQVGVAQGDTAAAPNAASKAGTMGGAPEAARDGADKDALNEYRFGLRRNGVWNEPQVDTKKSRASCRLLVVLSATNSPPSVIWGRRCGFDVLDEAVMRFGNTAVKRTKLPIELQGKEWTIPLDFDIPLTR